MRRLEDGRKKNSYIRGGCSDVGALTYYEKTTRSKIIICRAFIHENYLPGNPAYGMVLFEQNVARRSWKKVRYGQKKACTEGIGAGGSNKHTMRKLMPR